MLQERMGEGHFLFIYLFFVIAIGIPVMTSEFVIGRAAQKNPYGAFKILAPGKPWYLNWTYGCCCCFYDSCFLYHSCRMDS